MPDIQASFKTCLINYLPGLIKLTYHKKTYLVPYLPKKPTIYGTLLTIKRTIYGHKSHKLFLSYDLAMILKFLYMDRFKISKYPLFFPFYVGADNLWVRIVVRFKVSKIQYIFIHFMVSKIPFFPFYG